MKKSFLKSTSSHTTSIVDYNTGEVMETSTNSINYLANSKESFYLMYSSMILILKSSTDVKMKLFAALLERYSQGQEFSMNKGLKGIIALETKCQPRSLDSAFTFLVRQNIIVKFEKQLYKINPRHVFQGSTSDRNGALKAIIELGCDNC